VFYNSIKHKTNHHHKQLSKLRDHSPILKTYYEYYKFLII